MPDYIFNNGNQNNNGSNGNSYTNSYRVNNSYSSLPDKENPTPITVMAKKPEKKKNILGAVALICVLCIVFSGAAGFGGAYLANSMTAKNNVSAGASGMDTSDDPLVIYRSVVTESGEGNFENSYNSIVTMVEHSVVEITTEYQTVNSFFQYVTGGAGSGVIISENGYIVTNNHVVMGDSSYADNITVRLKNGEEYPAMLIGADSESDIAVIKIEAKGLTAAVFGDSEVLSVGDRVLAVGNPLGELGGSVTSGIISALDREIAVDGNKMNLLQTNAAVNPGNSGGGLFNLKGELIGIVNAKSSGSGIEGLGFAIPANDALSIIEQLMEYGYVRGKVMIGIVPLDITDSFTAMYYRVNSLGLYVMSVEKGYNDDVLQPGDRIISINGEEVNSSTAMKSILQKASVGDVLVFTISRGGKTMDVNVTCYEKGPEAKPNVTFEK